MINSIYLAYPIDQAGPASLVYLFEQINKFKDLASEHVSWIFDPGDAFTVNPKQQMDDSLARINRAALNSAEAVVAFLPAGVPSIGVPMEIDRARASGQPVLVFSDADSFMLRMSGVDRIFDWDDQDLADGIRWIQEIEPYGDFRTRLDPFAVKVEDEAFLPSRTYGDDAGLDLFTSEETVIPAGQFVDVPCGVAVELPERTWAMITGRSSTLRKRGLLVNPGIIDTGYRGPLFAGVWNQTDQEKWVHKGDRIAQLILFYNTTRRYHPQAVDVLTPSERGDKGFGSTGA